LKTSDKRGTHFWLVVVGRVTYLLRSACAT